jgi:hypothetical protein
LSCSTTQYAKLAEPDRELRAWQAHRASPHSPA